MKINNKVLVAAIFAGLCQTAAAAPWTYRGTLSDGGVEANGNYDLRVSLVDANGIALAHPITLNSVAVTKGSFVTSVDFGFDLARFEDAKIITEVQQGNSGFVRLGAAKAIAAPEGGTGQCWGVDGNSTLNPIQTVGVTDSTASTFLNITNGSSDLYMRGAGGVEQDDSQARGDNAAAWNNSSAAAAGSFTVGRGETGVGGTGSFVYSDALDSSLGNSNVAGQFLVRASGGIGFNAVPNALYDFTLGRRPGADADNTFGMLTASSFATMSLINSSGLLGFFAPGGFNFSFGANDGLGVNTSTLGAEPDFRFAEVVVKNSAGNPNTDINIMNSTNRGFAMAAVPGAANPGGGFFQGSFYISEINAQAAGATQFNAFFVRQENGVITMNRTTPAIGAAAFQLGTLCTGAVCVNNDGNGAYLSTGGTWTNSSARASKTRFAPINAMSILDKVVAMPITTWSYRNAQTEGMHMGPVAEDFKASFGLAGDGKSIGTVDADGVALAAIQGLNQKLESENAALKARLDAIEAQLAN
jgi:trimeric autotransporter adhesin